MRTVSALLILGLCICSSAAAEAVARHWYLPGKHGQWCSYASRAAWQKASDDNYLFVSASAHLAGGKVQSLMYFRSDESGDWAVIDNYSFKNGEVFSLTRTYNTFDKQRVVDTFSARHGGLVRTSRRYFSLDDKPVKPRKGVDYDAHMPAYARLDAMPFFPIVFERPKSGAVCRPAGRH